MSVCQTTRAAPSVSKAWVIISSFDSVLCPVRHQRRPSQVCPIEIVRSLGSTS
jgi:hypothetical protein